jgi:hypothetical protein
MKVSEAAGLHGAVDIKDDISPCGWQICQSNGAASMKKFKKDMCGKHLAEPILIGRPISIHSAGVSGKGNRFYTRWKQNQKTKGHLSPWSESNIYHLPRSPHLLFKKFDKICTYLGLIKTLYWMSN